MPHAANEVSVMAVLYTSIGATVFWVALSVAIMAFTACALGFFSNMYAAFAVWRFARANQNALRPGHTPRSFALEVLRRHPLDDRASRLVLSAKSGGTLRWQSRWRFRVTAGDPEWRSGDEPLQARTGSK